MAADHSCLQQCTPQTPPHPSHLYRGQFLCLLELSLHACLPFLLPSPRLQGFEERAGKVGRLQEAYPDEGRSLSILASTHSSVRVEFATAGTGIAAHDVVHAVWDILHDVSKLLIQDLRLRMRETSLCRVSEAPRLAWLAETSSDHHNTPPSLFVLFLQE